MQINLSSETARGNSSNDGSWHLVLRNFSRLFSVFIFGALVSIVGFTIWTARQLRPIADDYGHGVVADAGLLHFVQSLWRSWSGDLTSVFSVGVFVGIPVSNFPWALASSTSFVFGTLVMAFTGLWIWSPAISSRSGRLVRGKAIFGLVTLLTTWWAYWWLSVPEIPVESDDFALALAVTHWQTVVAGYVIPIGLVTWALLWLESTTTTSSWKTKPLFLTVGLLAGFNGPVFASSTIASILLLITALLFRRTAPAAARAANLMLGLLGAVVGALASYFSPGSQNRSALLQAQKPDGSLLYRVLTEAVPRGVEDWLAAVWSLSALVVVLATGGVAWLISNAVAKKHARGLFKTGFGLLGFSLLSFLASRASELFAYEAFWHLVGPRTTVWLGLTSIGIGTGVLLASVNASSLFSLPIRVAILGALYFLAGAIDTMVVTIIDRSEQWDVGPAPVYDTSDIEDPAGWVLPNWLELRQLRDAPPRDLP